MKTRIWIALLAVYLVWGSTYLVIRFAVETLPPFLSAGLRFLVSGLLLLAWRYPAGDALPTLSQWRSAAIVGTLLLLGGNGLVCWAEQTVPSGVAALMIGAVPMFLVLADTLRPNGVKPTGRVLAGLAVGFCGIYLLVSPSEFSDGLLLNVFGVAALLLAGMLWAIGSVYSKTADLPKSALMTTGAEMLAGGLSLMLASGLSDEWTGFSFAQVSTHSWLALAYLIAFGSMVGFACYIWLLQNAPIPLVATYAYVNPLVAVFLGNWFAQEPLTPRILAASAIIIGAVVFINSAHRSRVQRAAAPAESE
ncbi:EamA family transporter [Methylococcus mesophilus]|uniref:EamA family transporter n=1 Tax=Methylococcus mesophilus TaxID=2993564 RepID=UPI00224B856F|nr:EamA family transporter [Methylococcus mesophilus]UZR27771.1 EamA family transporter [Methylococcus mesophilus]